MPSYRLNIANVAGLPPAPELARKLELYGVPKNDEQAEFSVTAVTCTTTMVRANLIRSRRTSVQSFDRDEGEIVPLAVETARAYPLALCPDKGRVEVYAGSEKVIEHVDVFLSGTLGLPTVVKPIDIDPLAAVEKLRRDHNGLRLRRGLLEEFAANSFATGRYGPAFLDTASGMEFFEKYSAGLKFADVRWKGSGGYVNARISTTACFGYSCHEDDQAAVMMTLRELI